MFHKRNILTVCFTHAGVSKAKRVHLINSPWLKSKHCTSCTISHLNGANTSGEWGVVKKVCQIIWEFLPMQWWEGSPQSQNIAQANT